MEDCVYERITTEQKHDSRIVLCKQLFICSGVWTFYFIIGIYTGATTVIVPQMRRESEEIISDESVSWLNALYAFAATPWVYISAVLSSYIGKKRTLMLLGLAIFSGAMVFYFSTNLTHLFISECILSMLASSQTTLFLPQISECTSPKYRGVFMTLKSATLFWGIWISNIIGTYFHWRYVAVFGLVCSIYPLVVIPFWPESPYWLASKGQLDRCIATHRWMKGTSEEPELELKELLRSHHIKDKIKTAKSLRTRINDVIAIIGSKEFYKPILISCMVVCVYIASGKMICAVYAIDVMKKITHSESKAYAGMLILDGISVISTYVGCFLSKVLTRRFIMIFISSLVVATLFSISLYLWLVRLNVLVESAYVSITLLTAFSIAVCSGPMVMTTTLIGELLPLNNRVLAVCVISTFERTFQGMSYKFALSIFNSFNLDVVFLSFGVVSSFFIVLLYFYLPETKDKTLQEIADSFRGYKLNTATPVGGEDSPSIVMEDGENKS